MMSEKKELEPYTVFGYLDECGMPIYWRVLAESAEAAPLAMMRERLDDARDCCDEGEEPQIENINVCAVIAGHHGDLLEADHCWLVTQETEAEEAKDLEKYNARIRAAATIESEG